MDNYSGNLDILLRTSEQGRFPGFRAVVICIPTTSSMSLNVTHDMHYINYYMITPMYSYICRITE